MCTYPKTEEEAHGLRENDGKSRKDDSVRINDLLMFIDKERSEWMDLDGCIAGIRGFLAGIRTRR